MIKKVRVEQLKPGVYIHSFDCGWMAHPFLFNSKFVKDDLVIKKMGDWGIREVFIDTANGLDIPEVKPDEDNSDAVDIELQQMIDDVPDAFSHIPVREEITHAIEVKRETSVTIHHIMDEIRAGKNLQSEKAHSIVQKIDESISRNKDALILLFRIRNKDTYTFSHSVSVGVLMMSFCKGLKMERALTLEIGMGAILHDIGKMKVPLKILNKPASLTDAEFAEIKKHTIYCVDILDQAKHISPLAMLIASQHHERHDGTGYPKGLKDDEICQGGQMAAIVDVYDAITANRCYHVGMDPVDGLRKIFTWAKSHFQEDLAHRFIKCIGIYPIGTVVELESGLIGVVTDSTDSLLKPVVTAVYNKKKGWPISPRTIDLSRSVSNAGEDRIVCYECAERWNIDPMKILGLKV